MSGPEEEKKENETQRGTEDTEKKEEIDRRAGKHMRPVQITSGTCKFTIDPLPQGPRLEFTDFETDITWLSGYIYARLRKGGRSRLSRGLDETSWVETGEGATVTGMLEGLQVRMTYRLAPSPTRLEESITITNPSEIGIDIAGIRVGLTWTPPQTWWSEWSDWNLLMIPYGFDPSTTEAMTVGRSLGSLMELLDADKPTRDAVPVTAEGHMSGGWIITDGRRFAVVAKDTRFRAEHCPLDIYHLKKLPPGLVVGGIGLLDCEPQDLGRFEAKATWVGGPTVYIPGQGGWREGVGAYLDYRSV